MEKENLLAKLAKIEAFVFDVDGVFTDGKLILTEGGEMLRTMNTRDGFAVKVLCMAGVPVCVITGGKSEAVRSRFRALGIEDIFLNIDDKESIIRLWMERKGIDPSTICYMGDDIPDLDSMKIVGFKCCPNDADPSIINICDYISPFNGGDGCVRDILEKYLRITNRWPA